MQLNKQIDTMKRLPTLEIMKYINELLKELQSRNCYVLDFDNPDCSLDHIEYHAAEGWLPKGRRIYSDERMCSSRQYGAGMDAPS